MCVGGIREKDGKNGRTGKSEMEKQNLRECEAEEKEGK